MAVEVRGLTDTIRHLEEVARRSRDLSPVLEVAASDTVGLIEDAFDTGVSPGGMSWAPLLPSTLRKRRKGRGTGQDKILVDTARLRTSINAVGDARSLRFGTNVGYGMFHQFGTRQIVPRPFLPVEGDPGALTFGRSGAALAHWNRVRAMVVRYVLTGEVG